MANIFDWFSGKTDQDSNDKSRTLIVRPRSRDVTEQYTANYDTLRGIWESTYPGTKLSSGIVYSLINSLISFIGVPTPTSENEITKELLNEIITDHLNDISGINTRRLIVGTDWVYPHWSDGLRWRIIPDDCVEIIKDINTGEIVKIITNEQLTIQQDEGKQQNTTIKRIYEKEKLTTIINGSKTITKNPLGIMPIPFSKDPWGEEKRGRSILNRVLPQLKSYHDISQAYDELLAQFKTKMVIKLESGTTVDQWLSDNGFSELDGLDINTIDLMFIKQNESVDFKFPQGASTGYNDRLSLLWWAIVQGLGVPEILAGLIASGNQSSPEAQLQGFINRINDERSQLSKPLTQLLSDSIRLLGAATMRQAAPDFKLSWNRLSAQSESDKAIIFKNFCDGISKAVDSASITAEQVHALWVMQYPDATEADFDKYVVQRFGAAKFAQFKGAAYVDVQDQTTI